MIQGYDVPCKFGQVEFEIIWKKKTSQRWSGETNGLLVLEPSPD